VIALAEVPADRLSSDQLFFIHYFYIHYFYIHYNVLTVSDNACNLQKDYTGALQMLSFNNLSSNQNRRRRGFSTNPGTI